MVDVEVLARNIVEDVATEAHELIQLLPYSPLTVPREPPSLALPEPTLEAPAPKHGASKR